MAHELAIGLALLLGREATLERAHDGRAIARAADAELGRQALDERLHVRRVDGLARELLLQFVDEIADERADLDAFAGGAHGRGRNAEGEHQNDG